MQNLLSSTEKRQDISAKSGVIPRSNLIEGHQKLIDCKKPKTHESTFQSISQGSIDEVVEMREMSSKDIPLYKNVPTENEKSRKDIVKGSYVTKHKNGVLYPRLRTGPEENYLLARRAPAAVNSVIECGLYRNKHLLTVRRTCSDPCDASSQEFHLTLK
ncbi:hypothetical protein EVAR_12326_1 [Eumeta japonica]|uniref:Uncharacterized protein n=1 Tax=Eumeta variegata TaxID=151549 RepID=A0A4C1ZPY8_EUMVA|nr:hypothetical protein EVAR_12326_1 [Eumeta japonica]